MAQLHRRWQRLSAAARPVHHCSPADWHVVGDREPPRRPRPRLGACSFDCRVPVSTRAWSRSTNLSILEEPRALEYTYSRAFRKQMRAQCCHHCAPPRQHQHRRNCEKRGHERDCEDGWPALIVAVVDRCRGVGGTEEDVGAIGGHRDVRHAAPRRENSLRIAASLLGEGGVRGM